MLLSRWSFVPKTFIRPGIKVLEGGRGGREGWNCDGDGIYIYRPATVVSLLNTANSCRCQNMFDCVNGMGYIYVHVQGRDGKMRYSVWNKSGPWLGPSTTTYLATVMRDSGYLARKQTDRAWNWAVERRVRMWGVSRGWRAFSATSRGKRSVRVSC